MMNHWSKVLLCVVDPFHRDSYDNLNDNEDIGCCDWTKELFVKSSVPALIKRVEEKYEALYGLRRGGVPTSRLLLVRCLI